MIRLSLFFLIIGAISCEEKLKDSESITPFIVGGVEARPNAWPSQVFIKQSYETDFTFDSHGTYRVSMSFQCGGTLLNSTHILTAAHCLATEDEIEEFDRNWTIPIIPNQFYPTISSMFTVYAGAHNISFAYNPAIPVPPTVRVLQVSQIVLHPRYNTLTEANDIAVFRLTQAVQETNAIRYAILPAQSNTVPAVGRVGTVVGWGAIREGGPTSNVLRQVDISVMAMSPNCDMYPHALSANQICAGYLPGGRDSCQGDSGGGFYVLEGERWITVGVVSYGIGCARPQIPGIYIRISAYRNWMSTGRV